MTNEKEDRFCSIKNDIKGAYKGLIQYLRRKTHKTYREEGTRDLVENSISCTLGIVNVRFHLNSFSESKLR